MKPTLEQRWKNWWAAAGARGDCLAELEAVLLRYRETHRDYHALWHIDACLTELDAVRERCVDPAAVEMAIWFHDAVYDTRRKDNEAKSADLAAEAARRMGLSDAFAERVRELIGHTTHDHVPADADARLLLDIDLSSLGCGAAEFDANTAKVRREYAWVPEDAFRIGRAAAFRGFLERPAIYLTPFFRDKYETMARHNMQRYLHPAG